MRADEINCLIHAYLRDSGKRGNLIYVSLVI
jgi:hypothetical protein